MDRKTEKQPSSQSSKSSAPKSGGDAYFPMDKKPQQSPVKKYLLAALLLVAVGGGAYFASKNMGQAPQETSSVMVQDKIVLVNSIVNLSDDYDPEADQMVSRISDAAPAISVDVARLNQVKAAEAIAVLKNEQKQIVEQPQTNPDKAKLGLYKGILSKCYIGGNDVHWVNENGAILEHLSIETPLNGNASIARQMIHDMGGGLVVVIYEKGYEVYGSDGKLIKYGSNE